MSKGFVMTLARVFKDYASPCRLGRSVYKYTDCGPWITFVLADGREVYYEYAPGSWKELKGCVAIKVGSIVEGVDWETEIIEVPVKPMRTLQRRFFEAVGAVNEEANDIWNTTHGCEDCGEENEYGYITINPDCKTCHGKGVIL